MNGGVCNDAKTQILLIEDNLGDADLIREYLGLSSANEVALTHAQTLSSGLSSLEKQKFDILLLDLNLPDSNGSATFSKIHEVHPEIPIVLITGTDDHKLAETCINNGAQDFLNKKWLNPSLGRTIKNAIARSKTEKALFEREALLEKIFEILPIGLWFTDDKGNLLRGNPAGIKIWGREPRVGPMEYGIFKAWRLPERIPVEPDDWSLVKTIKNGETIKDELLEIEAFDGVRRIILNYTTPVFDSELRVKAGVVVNLDITEREKDAEKSRWLVTALEQAAEMYVITDEKGKIQYVNPAFLKVTGYLREEVIGKKTSILKSGEHSQDFYRDLWTTICSGQTWRGKMTNKKKNGEIFHEEATISPVVKENGEIGSFVAIKRDITQELIIENNLRNSQKLEAIGRLAGGIAHDFNNMLGVILGYGEEIAAVLADDDPLKECAEEILKAAARSAELTGQLLTFSRKQKQNLGQVDLNDVVLSLNNMLKRLIGENIEFSTSLYSGLDKVFADSGQMEQVIVNLVVNARDSMPKGGKVEISTGNLEINENENSYGLPLGKYVRLAVKDTGIGMTKEICSKIFEPFFSTKRKGTGLGLATVYGIVKQTKGEIAVRSELGSGTMFEVVLPAEANVELASSETIEFAETDAGFKDASILIVEDDDRLRKLLERMISSFGAEVVSARNGKEGLAKYEELTKKPNLILTDVIMPEMNGFDMVNQILQLDVSTKTLFISGYTDNPVLESQVLSGKLPYLQKPFTKKELKIALQKILLGDQ